MNLLPEYRWSALWQSLALQGAPGPWFARLSLAYAEPQRHYHTAAHLLECFAQLERVRQHLHQPDTVEFALWFHDAVYLPQAADNEERSAHLADQCLQSAGAARALNASVCDLILNTKSHQPGSHPDAPALLDIDLSILGQTPERFAEYEAQIQAEYAWVPTPVFRSKRAEILKGFLQRPRLFLTDHFYANFEAAARRNLEGSIRTLELRPQPEAS